MKLFLSYASEDLDIALKVKAALCAEKHEVFLAETQLRHGDAYNQKIRMTISDCDGFIFLISPDSVRPKKYTLFELEQAVAKWPSDPSRIMAFYARETSTIPPILPATTIERTEGSLPAKVAQVVARLSGVDIRAKKLTTALKVIEAVRKLDNAIRDHLSPFLAFDVSWSSDRRNDKIDALVAFASRSRYIVDLRNTVGALSQLLSRGITVDEVQSTYDLATEYLVNLGGPGSPTPFGDQDSMLRFFSNIRAATTRKDVEAIRIWATTTLNVVEPSRIEKEERNCQILIAGSRG